MAVQTLTELKMYIGGEWVESSSGDWVEVHNPATGELVGRVPSASRADVDRAVAEARESFNDGRWRKMWLP
ncbi:MAG: aldehyde dehydrogenase family protein, partial [Chloroflexi bacterium]|nr:aldehyde dehydrogenase family protein [Chloroflexota bacterium]